MIISLGCIWGVGQGTNVTGKIKNPEKKRPLTRSFRGNAVRTLRDPDLEPRPFSRNTVLPDRDPGDGEDLTGQKEAGSPPGSGYF